MTSENMDEQSGGRLRAAWQLITARGSRYVMGSLVVASMVIGVLAWGGFNWALEITNTEEFCISCHEMRDNVYEEYKGSIHDLNPAGVRATCPDCHVPKEWIYKIRRKIYASNELLHWILGTLDTKEKFNAKRLELSSHVWETMKATDSRECRNCHNFKSMDNANQSALAQQRHELAETQGKTCINCHKGIAHNLENKTCLRCHGDILDVETRNKEIVNPHRLHLLSQKIDYKGDNRDCLTCHEMVQPPAKVAGQSLPEAGQSFPAKEGWFEQRGVYHPNTLRLPVGAWKKRIVRPEKRMGNTTIADTLRPFGPHTFKPRLKQLVCTQCHGPDSKIKTFYGKPIAAPKVGKDENK